MLKNLLHEDFWETRFERVDEKKEPLPKGVIMRVKGPIGITEKENRNGRFYTNKFWDTILADKEVKEKIEQRAMVGAADHPKTFVPPVTQVSHVLTDAWVDTKSNSLIGTVDVLDTPNGRIVKTLYDANVKVGVSTRGAGQSVKKNGVQIVQEDGFKWGGIDFVFEPSAQNAYPEAVREQIEEIVRTSINESTDSDDKEHFKHLLESFGCNTNLMTEGPEEDFENKNKALTEQVKTLENKVADTTAKLTELQEKLDAMVEYDKSHPTDLSESVDGKKLLSEIELLKQEKDTLLKLLNGKTVEKEAIKEELLRSGIFVDQTTRTELDELKPKAELLDKEKTALLEENGKLSKDLEGLKSKLLTFEKEIGELRGTNSKLVQEKAEFISKIRSTEGDFSSLLEDYEDVKVKYLSLKTGISEEEIRKEDISELALEQAEELFSESEKEPSVFVERPQIREVKILNERQEAPVTQQKSVSSLLKRMSGGK